LISARSHSAAHVCACVVFLLLLMAAGTGAAQSERSALGNTASGLPGLVASAAPLGPRALVLSATGAYGLTEGFAAISGPHQRLQGTLGAAIAPLTWLAFSARLDGRWELHPNDGRGAHGAGFGEPRLFARAGRALNPAWSIGAELGLWLPGTTAPSIDFGASTLDGRALVEYSPVRSPWSALAALGYRWDNSAQSAPDLTRLRVGDRISLGLSDFDALLCALGLARRLGAHGEVFGELSLALLVGKRAPPLGESPLSAAIGGRWFFHDSWQAELSLVTSLSRRPALGPRDPLIPIEPRALLSLGLRYGHRLDRSPEIATAAPLTPRALVARPLPQPTTSQVRGSVVDDRGAPLPDAAVSLIRDEERRSTMTDAQGSYAFDAVPLGPAELEVAATGFETQHWPIAVDAGPQAQTIQAERRLTPKRDVGILRGLIRSFGGNAVRAQITVRDRRGKQLAVREAGEDGHFEIELAAGLYHVRISASGYDALVRDVTIGGNDVSILNVDLREAK
jgi:hypothetical protein